MSVTKVTSVYFTHRRASIGAEATLLLLHHIELCTKLLSGAYMIPNLIHTPAAPQDEMKSHNADRLMMAAAREQQHLFISCQETKVNNAER